jgi:hypothetical protein
MAFNTVKGLQTATFTVPNSVAKYKTLRMRVVSHSYKIPTACDNPQNGQIEDYAIKISTSTISSNTGTITPGSSDTIAITFNSKDFVTGTYTTNFYINSNAPENPTIVIPTIMNVTGTPNMEVTLFNVTTSSCLDLDTIIAKTTSKLSEEKKIAIIELEQLIVELGGDFRLLEGRNIVNEIINAVEKIKPDYTVIGEARKKKIITFLQIGIIKNILNKISGCHTWVIGDFTREGGT